MNRTTPAAESLPAEWDVARDETFFRIVADLLPTSFTYGGSVLLASYDDDVDVAPARTDDVARPGAGSGPSPRPLPTTPHRR